MGLDEMQMPNNDEILQVSLIPISCTNGQVIELIDEKCYLSDVIAKEQRRLCEQQQQPQYDDEGTNTNTNTSHITIPNITIIYLIRRSGCGGCKENGQIVSNLIKEYTNNNKKVVNISCFGILKEINVDNTSLINFYEQYFNHPLYVDQQWKLYNFLGNGTISLLSLLMHTPFALYRYYKKDINNVLFGGDIYTLGGLLFYYTSPTSGNNILYTKYYEKYGEPFETTMIRSIIRNMIQHTTTCTTAIESVDTSTNTITSSNDTTTITNTATTTITR